jgi:hypothetical protein
METQAQFVPRIANELSRLMTGSAIVATLIKEGGNYYVKYKAVPTSGKSVGLPETVDVLVPVPSGYATAAIDMPALPMDSNLIPHVVGGNNPQGVINVDSQQWQILSYHPYANGGGPPWNPGLHGFHDYYNHIYIWLHRLI